MPSRSARVWPRLVRYIKLMYDLSMDITHATPATCDPRPFLRHMDLARRWCQCLNQRDTERQVLRVMRRLSAADLERLLTERGIRVL